MIATSTKAAAADVDERAAPVLTRLGLDLGRKVVRRPHARIESSGPPLPSFNPANERALGAVATTNADDFDRILTSAVAAARAWRDTPAPVRGHAVRRYVELLREHKDALGTLVSLETGKIKAEGDGEVQEMIDIADFAVGQSRMLYGKTLHSERPAHRMYEQWHPLGVVGVITAFNFPVAVWAWNAMLACVCGNVVVWKPSPKAPLSAVAATHLAERVVDELGLPPIFSLAIGDDTIGRAMADDPRIALVSFTGSSRVGKSVSEAVSARFGKVLLECGGNNAVIAADDADANLVVPSVVFGAVGTAGQRCTSTRRLIIHCSRFDDIVARVAAAYRQVKIGDPLEPSTLMGPLIDRAAIEGFARALDEARAAGATIVTGGRTLSGAGHFVEPTIITGLPNTHPLVQRETFAPILYAMPYDTIGDAIAQNNGVRQGLSSALFTQSMRTAEAFLAASGSDCGIANINIGTSGAEIGGAFGGEKETGGGRESGSDAWRAYMRRQTNTINWSRDLPLAQGIRFDVERPAP
ncbi:MAG TPA: aldehyde dehydrogenase family protein [Casimicrobiaceae bacterium]|nr:aldehyde dehydrogenase family protein [Casimicrobiaceae bacterium]